MIDEPNPEADEAHDILLEQRGYERLHKDLQADAAKLAMWDELVESLADLTFDYRNTPSTYWKDKVALLKRARAIK